MKISSVLREIRESSDEELKGRLGRLEEELFGHRMKRYTNQLDNTMKIRQARREIARIRTVLAGRAKGVEKTQPKTEKAE
jgi:large subunit ribosomal protein L29